MLNKEHKEKAIKVIISVLSESSYIFAEPKEDETISIPNGTLLKGVRLEFSGAESGQISLYSDTEFLKLAAANMLGIDENTPQSIDKGVDALKELLNIIVGNYLTEVYGCDPIFNIGIPQIIEYNSDNLLQIQENSILIDAEGHTLFFKFVYYPNPQ